LRKEDLSGGSGGPLLFCFSRPHMSVVQSIGVHLKLPAVAYILYLHAAFKHSARRLLSISWFM